jgi:DNA-binding transcriptional MerR regulator/RimJ/RimL family protein N-acetyltransferase
MLTIGQLAAYTGVTVRAIRFYHQRGLLAEPARDASGYRRYDGQAAVELIRIKTLAAAGVPLARIRELLDAEPGEFAAAVTQIDEALKRKIREFTQHRRKIAELTGGERLFLPAEIVDILDELRRIGVSERTVRVERDAWILAIAMSPDLIPEWVRTKRAALDDPEFCRIYVLGDQALDWDPADPRIDELADAMAVWAASSRQETSPGETPASVAAVALLSSSIIGSSPAWERLNELSQKRLETLQDPGGAPVTGSIEIRGPRLLLRAFRGGEIDEEWQAMVGADPMVIAGLPDESAFRARLSRSGRLVDGQIDLAIDLDGTSIGRIQTFLPPGRPLPPGTFDLGIGLREHARGQGHGREALALFTGWLFEHAGAQVVEGATDPANAPMRAVFQRAGWAFAGPVTEVGREWAMYRLTREKWLTLRSTGRTPF